MGSSPEGSVGNFTSTSFRKMGCKNISKAGVVLQSLHGGVQHT